MTSTTLTLADFLLARIAEDEAVARAEQADAMAGWRWKALTPHEYDREQRLVLDLTARVLADCEAKRSIVRIHAEGWPVEDDRYTLGWEDAAGFALKFLARPYAAHEDFQPEWHVR